MTSVSDLGDAIFGSGDNVPTDPKPPVKPTYNKNTYTDPNVAKRIDPRNGDILSKAQLPHPSGRQITIDYNPKTGGVFLDSGELKDLSEIKDIIPRLETILSTNN